MKDDGRMPPCEQDITASYGGTQLWKTEPERGEVQTICSAL